MRKGFAILVSALCLIALVASTAAAQAKFGLNDIPTIKNKKALNLIIETGDAHGKTIPAIEEFTKKTGVKVNVERVASSGVYGKENVELMAGTGFYDLVYVETAWTTEWSDYLQPLEDLAKKYDPKKEAGLQGGPGLHVPVHPGLRPGLRQADGPALLHLRHGDVGPPGRL